MFEQYDVNIISLLILTVVLVNNIKNGGENRARQRMFRYLIICDMLLLIINAVLVILESAVGDAAQMAEIALQTAFLFFSVLSIELWALFCAYRSGRRVTIRGFFIMSIPLLVFAVILAFNTQKAVTVWDTKDHGLLFYSMSIVFLYYFICSFVLTWRSKIYIDSKEYYLSQLGLIAVVAVTMLKYYMQLSEPVVWSVVSIGLLVLQLFALDEKMNIDHLTGLYNRKYLDAYIEDLLIAYRNSQKEDKGFAALMLDIDNFKTINDTYGHVQGDKALINASNLLRKSVRRGDFVARYGGDEFMIVLDRCSEQTPQRVIRRFKDNVSHFNVVSTLPYKLSFSIGCKYYVNVRGLDAKDIFSKIDGLMYVNKQNKAASISRCIDLQR